MKRGSLAWPVRMALLAAAGVAAVGLAVAQIEGPERGIRPIASSGDFAVGGIAVNTTGKTAEEARQEGWREAMRLGWSKLWAQTHGGTGATLPDNALSGIVSAILVEQEQIGPHRYIARLGVLFDRARAGQILGVSGPVQRSAPLLVIPIQVEAGAPIVFEQRTEWQKAWARFRTADSSVDYVRPSGAGQESLIVNAGQTGRRNRTWWRALLDQFGAADVIVPMVRIERSYPGGPVTGRFSAFRGPDRQYLGSFAIRANSPDAVPQMMDQGVARMDRLFQAALQQGLLTPDPTLIIEQPVPPQEVKPVPAQPSPATTQQDVTPPGENPASVPGAQVATVTVQFDTPDPAALDRIVAAVRATPGVQSAVTTSLALGGTSVMRVQFAGDAAALRTALAGRGLQVSAAGEGLRIRP